jgi:hypothetical protein
MSAPRNFAEFLRPIRSGDARAAERVARELEIDEDEDA